MSDVVVVATFLIAVPVFTWVGYVIGCHLSRERSR